MSTDLGDLIYLMVAACMLRLSYEFSITRQSTTEHSSNPVGQKDFAGLSPLRRKWAEKSIEGYIRQQEKKWQRWDKRMFTKKA